MPWSAFLSLEPRCLPRALRHPRRASRRPDGGDLPALYTYPTGVCVAAARDKRQVPLGGTFGKRTEGGALHGYTTGKDDYLKRLRRIEGRLRGIAKAVARDIEVLH
ncbi:metal-sensing transcriptional repressor [Frankia sp. ACN1ag]|uniref:metal-sensing transcriptional repressor n=1 Tax=Frankia sp. ACN1ag TaxID=102891 RepID=UPI0037C08BD0